MFVVVEAKALARAMKIANAIIEPRNTIPILSTVKLTYGPKGLTVEWTDLDIFVKISVDEIDGRGEFQTCINARYLAAIIAAAGVAPIRIEPTTMKVPRTSAKGMPDGEYERYGANIEHGYASYEIETLPASDFPDLPGDRAGRIERFTNGMFTAMLRKVAFCISTEETRYYLNGVCWQAQPEGMRFAATDGHRLALCRYSTESSGAWSRIIPRKTVNFLISHLDGLDIDVHQIVKGNAPDDVTLDFVAAGIEVRSKLIDGTFPDIDRVVPKESTHALKLNREEVLQAIKQAVAVGGQKTGPAIRLHELDGRLHIERKNIEFGTAKIKTSTKWPEGAPSFGVNGRYMTEVIGHCQGAVTLGMTDAGSPFLISDDDKDMTRVVMPMRV